MTITPLEKGPRMSQAVIHNGIVHLAGQVGEGATVAAQTKDMLARVDRLLAIGRGCAAAMQPPYHSADHGDLLYGPDGLPR